MQIQGGASRVVRGAATPIGSKCICRLPRRHATASVLRGDDAVVKFLRRSRSPAMEQERHQIIVEPSYSRVRVRALNWMAIVP